MYNRGSAFVKRPTHCVISLTCPDVRIQRGSEMSDSFHFSSLLMKSSQLGRRDELREVSIPTFTNQPTHVTPTLSEIHMYTHDDMIEEDRPAHKAAMMGLMNLRKIR